MCTAVSLSTVHVALEVTSSYKVEPRVFVPPRIFVPREDCAKGATGVATVATPMLPSTRLRLMQIALSRRRAVQVAALGALWRAIGCAKHACGKRDSADGLRDLALCLDRIRIM